MSSTMSCLWDRTKNCGDLRFFIRKRRICKERRADNVNLVIRPPTGPLRGPGWAIQVMMGDNREGWFGYTIRIWQAVDTYDAFWEITFRQI